MRIRPLRVLAAFLLVLAALEVLAILYTPTYEHELIEAKEAYYGASKEHEELLMIFGGRN